MQVLTVQGQEITIDINAADDLGLSALHHAVRASNLREVATLLVNGAKVNVEDKFGSRPIDFAEALPNQAIVTLLRSFGGIATPQFP